MFFKTLKSSIKIMINDPEKGLAPTGLLVCVFYADDIIL